MFPTFFKRSIFYSILTNRKLSKLFYVSIIIIIKTKILKFIHDIPHIADFKLNIVLHNFELKLYIIKIKTTLIFTCLSFLIYLS